jgi:plasmid stabilization system protein ParE
MSYEIRVLARARQDLDELLTYISARSPEGAARLLARFEESLQTLQTNPSLAPLAPETSELEDDVRHILFRTRAGRTYRALFTVVGDQVRVLRIRGAGQRPLTRQDMESE